MQAVILFAILILVASGFIAGDFIKEQDFSFLQASISSIKQITGGENETEQMVDETVAQPTSIAQAKTATYITPTIKNQPVTQQILINTSIQVSPRSGEIIEETNEITFEFGYMITPPDTEGKVLYETKINGLDAIWKETAYNKRSVEFPNGPKEYTFQVRAKINNIVDPTPAQKTFKINTSPYFNKIEIYDVDPSNPKNDPSLITIRTNLRGEENINITNWELRGKYGGFLIPKGVETYNPLNKDFTPKDIIVRERDIIYISSESNPLGKTDLSFRPNQCMGYLEGSTQFPINISKSCPRIRSTNLPSYLDYWCKNYIFTLNNCEKPKYDDLKEYDLFSDYQCMTYLNNNFNYWGCYVNNNQNENFSESEWHIYTNRDEKQIMANEYDTVYLRDENGLFVDKYNYAIGSCRYKRCY